MYFDKKKSTLIIHVWNWYQIEYIFELLAYFKPKNFIFDCSTEYEYPAGFGNKDLIMLDNIIKTNNINAYFLLGVSSLDDYPNTFPPNYYLKTFKFLFYPYYFLNEVISHHFQDLSNPKLEYLFINHNNKPHHHRCMMVDEIVNSNLNLVGNFSWNQLTSLEEETEWYYSFKYFQEQIISIEDEYKINKNQYSHPGPIYEKSLFDIVSESTTKSKFITEKTYKPLVYGKPFIILSFKEANKHLESLGFKLFHNVVDYSFDSYDKIEDRVKGLCDELQRLSTFDYEEMKDKMNNEVQYNKSLTFTLNKKNNLLEFLQPLAPDIGHYQY